MPVREPDLANLLTLLLGLVPGCKRLRNLPDHLRAPLVLAAQNLRDGPGGLPGYPGYVRVAQTTDS